ncbi:MAG: carbohydrate kinase family protein [Bacteroidota bacterium]
MKILLIGHSIVDHFEKEDAAQIYPGGIYYSALGLLSVVRPVDTIYLLTGMNDEFKSLFGKVYKDVELRYFDELINMPEVILKISSGNERGEKYKNISSALDLSKVDDWNQFDGILINMITGFDITLDQLKYVRKNYHGKIYFDVHTLARGVDSEMKRTFRKIPDADEWIRNVDIIQCNENELRTISSFDVESEIIKQITGLGDKTLIITKGMNGASLHFKENESYKFYNEEGLKIDQVNSVGCGDIFGAVFFYSYLCSKELRSSLAKANKAASLAAAIKLIENPDKFLNDNQRLY